MADTVQVLMEKMIPELEDLQEKKLFTKVRVSIVAPGQASPIRCRTDACWLVA